LLKKKDAEENPGSMRRNRRVIIVGSIYTSEVFRWGKRVRGKEEEFFWGGEKKRTREGRELAPGRKIA